MAITHQTIRISNEIRVTVTGKLDIVTRNLVQAWARAWDQVRDEWSLAIADLIAASVDGQWPPPATVRRARRALAAMELTHTEILGLADLGGVYVTEATSEVLALEDEWQRRLIASQYPKAAGGTTSVAAHLDRIDANQIGAIVERTTETITSYRKPLADDAVEAMKQALVRGVALGENPRTAAARMLKTVEGRFNGGLTRALNIARTEMLDAHRSAAAASHFANSDVLAGWVWAAQLDTRTCPSCWAQHGSEHPLEEMGPIDHHQGRCARIPKTKTWKELGFNIDEPASLLPDAKAVFDQLPTADKLTIMGPVRLKALDTGRLSWSELSTRRTNGNWRDSYVPIPVWAARQALVYGIG